MLQREFCRKQMDYIEFVEIMTIIGDWGKVLALVRRNMSSDDSIADSRHVLAERRLILLKVGASECGNGWRYDVEDVYSDLARNKDGEEREGRGQVGKMIIFQSDGGGCFSSGSSIQR